jgi:hypothetical protein
MPGDPHPRSAHRASPADAAPGPGPGAAPGALPGAAPGPHLGAAPGSRPGVAPRDGSAHRANPAAGLALLTPQALVRQAQAGQARARQAIIRQALARQTRGHRAATHPASAHQPTGLPAAGFREVGLQTGIRLAAQFHVAERDEQGALVADRPTAPQHRRSHAVQSRAGHSLARQSRAGRSLAAQFLAGQPRAGHPRAGQPRAGQPRVGQAWAGQAWARQAWAGQSWAGQSWAGQAWAGQWPALVIGRQRRTAQRRAPREPQQTLQSILRGLATLIILAVVGLSAFFIIAEETRGPGRESAAAPGSEPGLASRAVDPEPLTQGEVFPDPTVQPATGTAGYQVTMTHSDSECRIATTGELGALLEDHGCDQVVRARLTAPYGGYQVTTGIFNLTDETGAAQVSDLAGTLVETGRGTFTTLGGSAGDPLAEPLAQVGWHSRGHYLLYCVVARPDGQLVTDDDPYAARITAELVEQYLGEQVVGQRTSDP